MNNPGVKIEIHLIQNFAPSNLNRDDTGQPKSAYFGGYRRARVSSQCGKRAIRTWWKDRGLVSVGERTKRLQRLIGDSLAQDSEFMKRAADEEDRKVAIRVFTDAYYAAADKKRLDNTSVLIFISPAEVDVCAEAVKELWEDWTKEVTKKGKKSRETVKGLYSIVNEIRQLAEKGAAGEEASVTNSGEEDAEDKKLAKKTARPKLATENQIEERIRAAQVSADIAMFGRMLAEQPGRNTDGACQVAHPISTHKVEMEMDFYTAVDDLNPAEETGAGMMGVIGFNSACYYRYALVDRDQLARNLSGKTQRKSNQWTQPLEPVDYQEADKVIKAFLGAMVYAVPTGKQNAFAAQNLPSFGLFVRRQGGVPLSLANAFARPVRPTQNDDDLVGLSVEALARHWEALNRVYGRQGLQSAACFHLDQEGRLNGLGKFTKESVEEAINALMGA